LRRDGGCLFPVSSTQRRVAHPEPRRARCAALLHLLILRGAWGGDLEPGRAVAAPAHLIHHEIGHSSHIRSSDAPALYAVDTLRCPVTKRLVQRFAVVKVEASPEARRRRHGRRATGKMEPKPQT